MELFAILWWVIGLIALIWVYNDSADKRGTNIGCLWALIVFILGPLGFIAYLIVRNAD
ncbi:hypothetical protein [Sutcliffiella halmapala]|uniref:hypothetical protein n=1 Tax=Sutcliffiella halmapala TaxID=79882 RepID=UPI0014739A9C|nr:hypothetical protein [Sutcliffiella halmapala]